MKKTNITINHRSVNLISICIYYFSNPLLKKMKTYLLLITFFISSFNVFAQTSSLISTCGDFVVGSATNLFSIELKVHHVPWQYY